MVDLGGITLIVTGFPRSGTSMMMRMLKGAGIDVLATVRGDVNKHSPYGSLELENVGQTLKNMTQEESGNHAVKLVTPYIAWLPIDRPIKAIFMQRDINEIITSLLAMRSIWDEDIAGSISWARGYLAHNEVPTLFVQYKEVVNYPRTSALRIEEFLGVELDIDGMLRAVDKNARQRYKDDKELLGHDKEEHIIQFNAEAYKDVVVDVYHPMVDPENYQEALEEKGVFKHVSGSAPNTD